MLTNINDINYYKTMIQPSFKDIRKEIISYLQKAKESIYIAMAWFTNEDLFSTILLCIERGVKVNVVLMDDIINHADFGIDFNRLVTKGGNLYLFPKNEKMMHNKFCVIDSCCTITGSYNWTNYAESRNYENIIIINNQEVSIQYLHYFSELLNYSKSCDSFESVSIDDIDEETFAIRCAEFYQEIHSLPDTMIRIKYVNHIERLMQKINRQFRGFSAAPNDVANRPVVKAIENRSHPISKYNIGFKAYLKEKGIVGLKTLIEKGTALPCVISRDAWTNNDNLSEIECVFLYGETGDLASCKDLVKLKLNNLPKGKSGEIKFRTNIAFDTNGYLRIEFYCINTGKGEETTCIKEDFVIFD